MAIVSRSLAEMLSLAEPGLEKLDRRQLAPESTGAADASSRRSATFRTCSDVLGLLDLFLPGARTFGVTIGENVAVATLLAYNLARARALFDGIAHADAVARTTDIFRRPIDSAASASAVRRIHDARRQLIADLMLETTQGRSSAARRLTAGITGAFDTESSAAINRRRLSGVLAVVDMHTLSAALDRLLADLTGSTTRLDRMAEIRRRVSVLIAVAEAADRTRMSGSLRPGDVTIAPQSASLASIQRGGAARVRITSRGPSAKVGPASSRTSSHEGAP